MSVWGQDPKLSSHVIKLRLASIRRAGLMYAHLHRPLITDARARESSGIPGHGDIQEYDLESETDVSA